MFFSEKIVLMMVTIGTQMQTATNLKLKSSSDAEKRPKEGSNCIPRDTEVEFEALLNCCKRDHRSLYNLSSLGYSPSNACFKNVEAGRKETIPFIAENFRYFDVDRSNSPWAACANSRVKVCVTDSQNEAIEELPSYKETIYKVLWLNG